VGPVHPSWPARDLVPHVPTKHVYVMVAGPCRRLPVEPNGRKGATTRVVTVFGMRTAPGQCEQVNWLSSRTHAIGPLSFANRLEWPDGATPSQPVVTALTVFTTCVHRVSMACPPKCVSESRG
jgi:hypothetical protein